MSQQQLLDEFYADVFSDTAIQTAKTDFFTKPENELTYKNWLSYLVSIFCITHNYPKAAILLMITDNPDFEDIVESKFNELLEEAKTKN